MHATAIRPTDVREVAHAAAQLAAGVARLSPSEPAAMLATRAARAAFAIDDAIAAGASTEQVLALLSTSLRGAREALENLDLTLPPAQP